MTTHQHALMISFMVTLTALLGCKRMTRTQTSDLNTIGELSGQADDKAANGCSGKFTKDSFFQWAKSNKNDFLVESYNNQITIEAEQALVERNLSAIPHTVLGTYLGNGGRIHFARDISKICKQATNNLSEVFKKRGLAQSCVIEGEKDGQVTSVLVIAANAQAVKTDTVLSLLALAQRLFPQLDGEKKGGLTQPDTAALDDFKLKLARSLLLEGLNSGVSDFSLIRGNLSLPDQFFSKETSASQREQLWNANAAKVKQDTFALNDIFNNVGDSYHCSDATFRAMFPNFRGTADLWHNRMAAELEAQRQMPQATALASVERNSSTVSSEQEGFGLWFPGKLLGRGLFRGGRTVANVFRRPGRKLSGGLFSGYGRNNIFRGAPTRYIGQPRGWGGEMRAGSRAVCGRRRSCGQQAYYYGLTGESDSSFGLK